MGHETYHEPFELLSAETRDMHRAIISLIEELEAVDWYQQRAEGCTDDALRGVLIHNKNEEIEHAMMTLEWMRRNNPAFDANARTYLFRSGAVTAAETEATGAQAGAPGGALGVGTDADRGAPAPAAAPVEGSLGLGSLKG